LGAYYAKEEKVKARKREFGDGVSIGGLQILTGGISWH